MSSTWSVCILGCWTTSGFLWSSQVKIAGPAVLRELGREAGERRKSLHVLVTYGPELFRTDCPLDLGTTA